MKGSAMKKKRSLLREVLTAPKYDVTEFIIPVSDSKGHSTPIALRCQSRFIRARKYPYKTPSDILRHALYRHIHWLHEQEPECASTLVYLDAAVEIGRRQQMHLEFTKTIEYLKSTIDQLEKADMKGEAKKMIRGGCGEHGQ